MLTVPEGGAAGSAILAAGDGYLVQPLPFEVHLKRFSLEQHANGQPRDFASEIEIRDGTRVIPLTLRVNQPATYAGVTLYQSGFDDGGSSVALRLGGSVQRRRIGQQAALLVGDEP
ncbi:cytochrome c biogenesis protein ResB, partial [Acinetobacter baumannii]|nr:cytochrome c biogenesis protein ResB [Acinetobacter baumannii]